MRGPEKTLRRLRSPLLEPSSKVICKNKAKTAIYKQEEILSCDVVLAFSKSVKNFLLLLFPTDLCTFIGITAKIDKYVMLCSIPHENIKHLLLWKPIQIVGCS